MKLSGARQFQRVYQPRVSVGLGAIVVHGIPNGLAHPRLGLAVPRRVGTAVLRNTIKRRLREAFRLMQHDWPAGYDVIVTVKPHAPLTLAAYRPLLAKAARQLHSQWTRSQPQPNPAPTPPER